jgi:2-polyprenyl-6-methoxyphenol hydroxylase-like FAD-dependent oxidoreductase
MSTENTSGVSPAPSARPLRGTLSRSDVLVVGGGLAGLSTAMLLAAQDVPTIVVERHPASSPHPRAIGYTPRSVEIFRTQGLDQRFPRAPGVVPHRIRVTSLAGEWFEEQPWNPPGTGARPTPQVEYSPCGGAGIAQDKLEPMLRERARELGADIRMSTELVSFTQDDSGVTALVRGPDGSESEIRARYLVGADGHRSPVREALGVDRHGRGFLRIGSSILFRGDLDEYFTHGYGQFVIDQPDLTGMVTTYGEGRWAFFLGDDRELEPDQLRPLLDRVTGRPDLDFEIITTGRWVVSAYIADAYRRGRVFLAGDAAHTLPANRGGYGVNVGIEDAHNLAWKLAAVLSGRSGDALLDTYEAERRPVALLCHDQLFARIDVEAGELAAADVEIFDDRAMVFGQHYRSTAVLDTDDTPPPVRLPDQWRGEPGTRAPHLWLADGRSTLDLFGPGWVLLADGDAWADAAERAAAAVGIDLAEHRIDVDLRTAEPDALRSAFGLSAGGAALVRPDGYIAWRSTTAPEDPAGALTDALARASSARRSAPAPA